MAQILRVCILIGLLLGSTPGRCLGGARPLRARVDLHHVDASGRARLDLLLRQRAEGALTPGETVLELTAASPRDLQGLLAQLRSAVPGGDSRPVATQESPAGIEAISPRPAGPAAAFDDSAQPLAAALVPAMADLSPPRPASPNATTALPVYSQDRPAACLIRGPPHV